MQVCLNVPNIVYSNSWVGQTSYIGSTDLFTPSADGLYRLTYAGKLGSSSGFLNISPAWAASGQIYYAGEGSGQTSISPGANNYVYGDSEIIFGQAGVPIALSTTVGGTLTYDLYVTLEQLQ